MLRARVRAHLGLKLSEERLREETARASGMERERIAWLENLARFLRHELRNQIVGVRTSLGLLDASELPSMQKYVERAQESLGRMHRLVSSATEATSLEGALDAEQASRIQLSHVVADRVTSFEQAHPSLRFARTLDEEVWVSGNEDRLVQLLDKLLSNAVEHADPGGQIRVSLSAADAASCLRVENDGPPLPDDREQLFTAFFSGRVNASSENLGLGLYVAKVIAESHGGRITASDLDDGKTGARFEVRLPLAQS